MDPSSAACSPTSVRRPSASHVVRAVAEPLLLRGRAGTLRVKVCCIASPKEVDLAIAAGADALGLVSAMPSGPGPIPESEIASIVRHVGDRAATVLLTSRQDAAGIGEQLDRIRPTVVQLVDELPTSEYAPLRTAHPTVVIGSYPFQANDGFAAEIVLRTRDEPALAAAEAKVRALAQTLLSQGKARDFS